MGLGWDDIGRSKNILANALHHAAVLPGAFTSRPESFRIEIERTVSVVSHGWLSCKKIAKINFRSLVNFKAQVTYNILAHNLAIKR